MTSSFWRGGRARGAAGACALEREPHLAALALLHRRRTRLPNTHKEKRNIMSALGNQKWSLAVIGHGTEGRDAGSCELSRARVPMCASTRSSCSLSIAHFGTLHSSELQCHAWRSKAISWVSSGVADGRSGVGAGAALSGCGRSGDGRLVRCCVRMRCTSEPPGVPGDEPPLEVLEFDPRGAGHGAGWCGAPARGASRCRGASWCRRSILRRRRSRAPAACRRRASREAHQVAATRSSPTRSEGWGRCAEQASADQRWRLGGWGGCLVVTPGARACAWRWRAWPT